MNARGFRSLVFLLALFLAGCTPVGGYHPYGYSIEPGYTVDYNYGPPGTYSIAHGHLMAPVVRNVFIPYDPCAVYPVQCQPKPAQQVKPVASAPAPASDLEAENQKLRKLLDERFVDKAKK